MAWISRFRALLAREKLSKELEEELEFHLSMREQWNLDQGMKHGDARRDARRRFGNPATWRERMSEIDVMIWPQTVLQDLRYGARMLRRNAGFTLVSVLALGIGIGATPPLSPPTRRSSSDLSMPASPDGWSISRCCCTQDRLANLAMLLPRSAFPIMKLIVTTFILSAA